MRFYIASKFENQAAVLQAINYMMSYGHQCTMDWTAAKEANALQAILDVRGVLAADIVIGLFDHPTHEYKGAIAEIGMAIATNKLIFIIGNRLESMIFMHLPNIIKVKNTAEIIKFLDSHRVG